MGASIQNNQPSPILQNRLDSIIHLYKNKKISTILISGDNTKKRYREVDVMRSYLIKHKVKKQDILKDHHGTNTQKSIHNSKKLWNLKDMTIVTQKFHLNRALFLAQQCGINAHGYPAKGFSSYIQKIYHVGREFLARYLAIWNVISGECRTKSSLYFETTQ